MLKGKTVLITGSSRGIGAATAIMASKRGAKVILHGKTESAELRRLAKRLKARYIACDASDAEAVSREVEKLRKVDVLINNAGISISKPFIELTDKDWSLTLGANIMGTVNFSRAVLPQMQEGKGGRIVNISSIKGFPGTAGRAAFASSKAALITLTASMAKEFAPLVSVNCIAPGFTETETTKKDWNDRIYKQIEEVPLRRAAQPKEIAEAILFLASESSSYVNGQTLIVDGGYSIRG
jgi:3-oxoacyl-[acyl-carrier protein] reductase